MSDLGRSIDELVQKQELRQHELEEIGASIRSAHSTIVIAFIDLVNSTQLKQDTEPDVWLGNVYRFLIAGSQVVKDVDGTVVKRIGDELMVTFPDTISSERFIENVATSQILNAYKFKIALDFGEVYHLSFGETKDDPYGEVVDRCARIAKFAKEDSIICSAAYRNASPKREAYISIASVGLKGFREFQEICLRPLRAGDSLYLKPLLAAINENPVESESFRTIARPIDATFIQQMKDDDARPFMARELLNLPRLGLSIEAFMKSARSRSFADTRRASYGHYVEWEGSFDKFVRKDKRLILTASFKGDMFRDEFEVVLPLSFVEQVRSLKQGDMLCVRGVIIYFAGGMPELNYADFQKLD